MEKRKLTLKQMYKYLFVSCKNFKEVNAKNMSEDTINRQCNIYCIKHTVKCWKEQFRCKSKKACYEK